MSSEKSRTFLQRYPTGQLKTFLVALFDQLLGVTFQLRGSGALPRRVFENESPVEFDFLDQR